MKRAIVTGASGLIGTGICARLAEAGWEVAGFDLAPPAPGGPARHVECDLRDPASVDAAFAALGWDRLDLLVNNGGRAKAIDLSLATITPEEWHDVLGGHLDGAFLMTRAALPLLAEGASVINMASTRAFMSEGGDFAYAAAKGGLVGLTQALSVHLGPRVRVNAIAPGWISGETALRDVDHAQHPAGRVGRPDDIAGAVLWLAGAGFMTGQVITVDGGMTRKMIYEG